MQSDIQILDVYFGIFGNMGVQEKKHRRIQNPGYAIWNTNFRRVFWYF